MKKPQRRRGNYKVGKGRPPEEFKFKSGQCGNALNRQCNGEST